ncbi:hypothetical protein Bca4012_068296 [Brassica carinata]
MGKKDEKVEALLHLLRKQSTLTLKQEKFCNRECVERFLKAKGDNVKKAAKQLLSCLSWRQSIEIERLGAEEFSTELSDGVAYIAGHDGDFRPVIGVRPFVELSTLTTVISSLDYDEQLDISHVSSSCPRSVSLRFDASSIKSTATSGSASSRFAFTVSQNSLKPWYLSFTDTSPLNATVSPDASTISPISTRSLSFASPAARGLIDTRQPACMRKNVFPSTPLPEKMHRKTPRPSFFQSPAMFFRGERNVSRGGEKSSREAFVPYLKFYRRPFDETAYRSKLRVHVDLCRSCLLRT